MKLRITKKAATPTAPRNRNIVLPSDVGAPRRKTKIQPTMSSIKETPTAAFSAVIVPRNSPSTRALLPELSPVETQLRRSPSATTKSGSAKMKSYDPPT